MHTKIAVGLSVLSAGLSVAAPVIAATPATWTTTIDAAQYGAVGTIQFNDWGYQGPTGADASTFAVTSPITAITGFDSSRIGQIQQVVTKNPDWLTRDGTQNAPGARTNASLDAQVNFANNLYTTVAGSTFSDMTIDRAGNYFVAKNNMSFAFYDVFKYHDMTGAKPDANVDTAINFKPYAISDALGWCGSTLISDPSGLSVMGGQVKFDFIFDAYLSDGAQSTSGGISQLIPDFIMRSYGSYVLSVTNQANSVTSVYQGSAVMNNMNPTVNPLNGSGEITTVALDPNFQNQVSFLGAGTVPLGVWVTEDSYLPGGAKRLNPDGTWNVTILDVANPICDPDAAPTAPVAGATCYKNTFAGNSFLLRADANRTLTYVNPEGHSDYLSAVPVPGAVWLMGSGLLGLAGAAQRKRKPTANV